MNLAVAADEFSFWTENHGFIPAPAVRRLCDKSAQDKSAVMPRSIRQKCLGFGRLAFPDGSDIHTEPRRKHFRQDDERARRNRSGVEKRADLGVIRLLVLPDTVDLASNDFHRGSSI